MISTNGLNLVASLGILTDLSNPLLWFTAISFATPLVLAALGGVISERAGIVNIALEGLMLIGAFFSALGVDQVFHSLGWGAVAAAAAGVVAAVASGALVSLLLAFASIHLRANQIVVGVAINIAAVGLTSFLFATIFPASGGLGGLPSDLPGIPNAHFPVLSGIKFMSLGYILFDQSPLVYVALILLVLLQVVLYRTVFGLRLRSAGEDPAAAEAAGVRVRPLRYLAVMFSGALAGLGGSFLVLNGSPAIFSDNMTQGRGFIALAAVVIGRWTPIGAVGACLLFGFAEAFATSVQSISIGGFQVTNYLLSALPYLVAMALAVGLVPAAKAPRSLGRPFAG